MELDIKNLNLNRNRVKKKNHNYSEIPAIFKENKSDAQNVPSGISGASGTDAIGRNLKKINLSLNFNGKSKVLNNKFKNPDMQIKKLRKAFAERQRQHLREYKTPVLTSGKA